MVRAWMPTKKNKQTLLMSAQRDRTVRDAILLSGPEAPNAKETRALRQMMRMTGDRKSTIVIEWGWRFEGRRLAVTTQ